MLLKQLNHLVFYLLNHVRKYGLLPLVGSIHMIRTQNLV